MLIIMKFLLNIFASPKKKGQPTLADHQRELLIRLGRDQFKKLVDQGLGIPVALS